MARRTTCTTVNNIWDGVPGFDIARGIIAAVFGVAASIIPLVAGLSASGITPAAIVAAAAALMIACLLAIDTVNRLRDYYFDHKLVCFGADECSVAQVISIEANADGDHSMNTILAPAILHTISEPNYRLMFQPAHLVYPLPPNFNPVLTSRGYAHNPAASKTPAPPENLPFFHCEIEGTRVDDLTTVLLAYLYGLLAFAVLAMALGILGSLLLFLGIAIPVLLLLFLFLAWLFPHLLDASADDVPSTAASPIGIPDVTGPLVTDSSGRGINVNDYVAILGRHICDAGHGGGSCWNEFHPVKAIARITQPEYAMVVPFESGRHAPGDIFDRYCDALRVFVTSVAEVTAKLNASDEHPADVDDPHALRPLCVEHRVIG